jgi:hypothetical protein
MTETTTRGVAERHEVLWVRLTALHKSCISLGAKKPGAAVSEPVRIEAEGLLSDCVPFSPTRRHHLPPAAPDLAGLAVQLGQAIAMLDSWQSRHTAPHPTLGCLMWDLGEDDFSRPVMRLNPPAAAMPPQRDITKMREKLVKLEVARDRRIYDKGFKAGLAARVGKPEKIVESQPVTTEEAQAYPRVRWLG